MGRHSSCRCSRVCLVLGLLCLCVSCVTVQAVNVVAFAGALQTMLRSIAPGFVTYYSALVGQPAVKAQFCTNSIVNMAPGLALAMESLHSPYGLIADAAGLIIYKDNYVYGPAINLIGTSYRITDGSMATGVSQGNSLLFPYTANSIIMVTGTITNGTTTNVLPMARYMIVDGYLCNSMYADITKFSSSLTTLFRALANAAV
ncbi:hypothetical protein N2W54_000571 [Lotmaria passim]